VAVHTITFPRMSAASAASASRRAPAILGKTLWPKPSGRGPEFAEWSARPHNSGMKKISKKAEF
jgi:hypothetical protein